MNDRSFLRLQKYAEVPTDVCILAVAVKYHRPSRGSYSLSSYFGCSSKPAELQILYLVNDVAAATKIVSLA